MRFICLISNFLLFISWLSAQGRVWSDVDTGYCLLTVSADGGVGYANPPDSGHGFRYPKNRLSHLFWGGIVIGNSQGYIVDRCYDRDWKLVDSMNPVIPPLWGSEQMYKCLTSDADHPIPEAF